VLFRAGPRSWPLYLALYALILLPSALWLPLTFAYLDAESVDAQSAPLWWAVQGVLFLVAIGSLGLVAALVVHPPRRATLWWALAILGAIAFAFQTVVLDALVWPAYVS
jgi:quinol-cytochrome oxidoreductase complex cytochrome b subunit